MDMIVNHGFIYNALLNVTYTCRNACFVFYGLYYEYNSTMNLQDYMGVRINQASLFTKETSSP